MSTDGHWNNWDSTGRAVVVGAGTTGRAVAALIANAGWNVSLLDVTAKGASNALDGIVQARPPLLYVPDSVIRIETGSLAMHRDALGAADWIVESVGEDLTVKEAVLAEIEAGSGERAAITSNTSGLSLRAMVRRRSPSFRARFLGAHFLAPPRYLKLVEVIPTADTDPPLVDAFARFAEFVLGKRVVFARDTPGFIATRVGIWHLLDSIHLAVKYKLTVEEADALTGTWIGRPRIGTFRMADAIGYDNVAATAADKYERLIDDPYRDRYLLPDVVTRLMDRAHAEGDAIPRFYRRDGDRRLALDFTTGEYRPQRKPLFPAVQALLALPLPDRFAALTRMRDEPCTAFLNDVLDSLSAFLWQVAPEIADDVLAIDRVMRWGFGWEMGPFEMMDCRNPSSSGSAYRKTATGRLFLNFIGPTFHSMPNEPEFLSLELLKEAGGTVMDSQGASLVDIGEGVACLEFHTKLNTLGPEQVAFIDRARERAERDFAGLVIGNDGPHFSAGYDLRQFADAFARGDEDAVDRMLSDLQYAFRRLRYSHIPIIAAPHGYALGGGCECVMHCHAAQCSPELYMCLPEMNSGVFASGGGATILLARAMARSGAGDPLPQVERVFEMLLFPRRSTSAYDARRNGFLRLGDRISRNGDRRLFEARTLAIECARSGYSAQAPGTLRVLGEQTYAHLTGRIEEMRQVGLIDDHDRFMAERLANFLSGGQGTLPRDVDELEMLHLERSTFLDIARQPPSQARIRHILATGKPLKN